MKKIVRGNDFTLRIPVKKIVNGEQVSFPLTDCTDIAVHVVSKYKRTALPYTIDKESNDVLLADVDGTTLSLGTYAYEQTVDLADVQLHGFILTIGQMMEADVNKTLVDEVVRMLHGSNAKLFSSLFSQWKWTSTQSYASSAWFFGSSPSFNTKSNSFMALPVFAC